MQFKHYNYTISKEDFSRNVLITDAVTTPFTYFILRNDGSQVAIQITEKDKILSTSRLYTFEYKDIKEILEKDENFFKKIYIK